MSSEKKYADKAGITADGQDDFADEDDHIDIVFEETDELEFLEDSDVVIETASRTMVPAVPQPNAQTVSQSMPQSTSSHEGAGGESALDRLLKERDQQDWTHRAAVLNDGVLNAEELSNSGELAYELGELFHRNEGNQSAAIKAYGRALQAEPALRANLWAIRRISYQRELWPNLVRLIDTELRFASNDAQRVDLYLELGHVLLHYERNVEAAREKYEKALALSPGNLSALLAMESVARESNERPLLLTTLQALADATQNSERKAAVLVELAQEYRQNHENFDQALQLLAVASRLDVMHEMVDTERETLAVAMGDFKGYVISLERRIARLQRANGRNWTDAGVGALVAMRRHQARLLIEIGELDWARVCLRDGLFTSPGETLILADLAEMAEQFAGTGDSEPPSQSSAKQGWEHLAEWTLRRIEAVDEVGLSVEANELLHARSLAMPGYLPLVSARELRAVARQDWVECAGVQVELADGILTGTSFGDDVPVVDAQAQAVEHYVVAGDYLRFGAGDLPGAHTLYQKALKVQPGHRGATIALCTALVAKGRLHDAASIVRRLNGDDPNDLLILRVRVHLSSLLGHRDDELSFLRRLRDLCPNDESIEFQILELFRERSDYENIAPLARELAVRCAEPETKARLYFSAGRAYQHLNDRNRDSVLCFRRCLESWHDEPIVIELLSQELRRGNDWQGLVEHLLSSIRSSKNRETADWAREVLAVLEFELQDSARACDVAVWACDEFPGNVALLLDACACLTAALGVDLFTPSPHTASLIDLVGRLVQISDGELKNSALTWLGSLHLGLREIDKGKTYLERAAARGCLPALFTLQTLKERQGDSGASANRLIAIADGIDSSTERASLLEQAGWQRALLRQETAAMDLFRNATAADSGRLGPKLGTVLIATRVAKGPVTDHGDVLAALSTVCVAPRARAYYLLRAAVVADCAGEREIGSRRIKEACEIAPDDPTAIVMASDRLGALSSEGRESLTDLRSIADICERRAALAVSVEARVGWTLHRAEALERLGRLSQAFELVRFILRLERGNFRALVLMKKLYLRGGDRMNAGRVLLSLAVQMVSVENRLLLLREAVAIFDSEDGDIGAAVASYHKILEENGGAVEYVRLVELLQRQNDDATLLGCYTTRVAYLTRIGDVQATIPILRSRARLRERYGDLAGATSDLHAVSIIDGTDLETQNEYSRLKFLLRGTRVR